MYELIFNNLRYLLSLLFGLLPTYQIADVLNTRRNRITAAIFSLLVVILQSVGYLAAGETLGRQIYPFMVHIPLILFLAFFFRKHWLVALTSVLSAYFCCQPPNWVSRFLAQPFTGTPYAAMLEFLFYAVCIALFFYIFMRFLASASRELLHTSQKTLLAYMTLPLIYYVFDYATTVYTDLLYQGNWLVVQFMPAVSCIVYFLTVTAYQHESKKQAEMKMERDLLAAQLNQAHIQLSSLQYIQQETAKTRHDMRHHLSLLKGYLLEDNLAQALKYLDETEESINAITPEKYCKNESVNLICSHFSAMADKLDCRFLIDIRFPEQLPLQDTELCVLLSNSLENAIHAVEALPPQERVIAVELKVFRDKLLISVENTCPYPVVIKDGLPQNTAPGHGYGVQSMAAIVHEHKGNILFTSEQNRFKLQAVIPLSR